MAADVAEMQASTIPMVVSSTNGGGGGGGGGAAKGHIASMDTIEKMLEFHVALARLGRRVEHFQSLTCFNGRLVSGPERTPARF